MKYIFTQSSSKMCIVLRCYVLGWLFPPDHWQKYRQVTAGPLVKELREYNDHGDHCGLLSTVICQCQATYHSDGFAIALLTIQQTILILQVHCTMNE